MWTALRPFTFRIRDYGEENTTRLLNQRINETASMADKFRVAHQTQGFILFKVV